MAEIVDIHEAWHGHSGLEVETFLKRMLVDAMAASEGKVGYVELSPELDLIFREYEGGDIIVTIPLGRDRYSITVHANVENPFYILADETEKMITISAETQIGDPGGQKEDFPEDYTYEVSVNTGSGFVPRLHGNIPYGGSATFNILPYLDTGDNFIRIGVTGQTSGQVKSVVYTGVLTSLTLSCSHAWKTPWHEEEDYIITGIRFAGTVHKYLHVSVDGVEFESVHYNPNQSYTTSATTYKIPASAFPASAGNGVHEIKLWMTASGISTQEIPLRIMCVAEGDTTPLIAINNITKQATNFSSERLFSYAVFNADEMRMTLTANLGTGNIPVGLDISATGLEEDIVYDFSYPLEVDGGEHAETSGTLTAIATPYLEGTAGANAETVVMTLDNTFSYFATGGALFYLNAASRNNNQSNRNKIVNDMGASLDGNFLAEYDATWSGVSWVRDGWVSDENGHRALCIPAGSQVRIQGFAPLHLLPNYPSGITLEMMFKCSYPSEYESPVFSLLTNEVNPVGLAVYPTKIVVYGSNESSEVLQSVNISENTMTHVAVTFVKNYDGNNSRNLVSVYINGISNVNFAFDGSSSFGDSDTFLTIGQQDTDAYLYKMRVYGSALDARNIFNNFLNCVVDSAEMNRRHTWEKNAVLDGDVVDYRAVKDAGFNTMVVIMDEPSHPIPSFNNETSYKNCSLRFEYADTPEKSVTLNNIALDGQGTTSMKYFRWNLRAKTNDNTVWTYGNGSTETGKEGYFYGTDMVRVDRITAKKNYASSMQGHKMGMTGLYNDLFHELGFGSELPTEETHVAVYQFPFVGFVYNPSNDSYDYIGLYTAGPDKGSKVTFGYNKKTLPDCLSIEGPNHAPRGTRFLHPWCDVTYDPVDETLKFGGEEGWDCDYVKYETSTDGTQEDWDAIRALYESEWRPAYEIVFNCSPYIVSAHEMIEALNNPNITTVRELCMASNAKAVLAGSTNGISNKLLCFYNSHYELYFYRTATEKFESLADVDSSCEHNVVTYLLEHGYLNTPTPTTEQIIEARIARFKAEAENTWYMRQTLYHYAFCLMFGVSDNFAKNSYPQKFRALTDTGAGNRWGWREDDMDTVLMTDNNGQNTKRYDVEHGDTVLGVEVYQGGNSALWVIIRDYYPDEVRQMMISLAQAANAIAIRLGIQGDGLHNSLMNVASRYIWENSAKYFAETLYEKDRRWSYIEPWLRNAQQTYNNVYPLTQALGDQYQGEHLWMERRIAYMFSKYRIGVFSGDVTVANDLSFTLGEPFTFHLSPAITLYPVVSLANTADRHAGRTFVGEDAEIYVSADGQTTNYVHGCDWLSDLGDLSEMVLTSRGGSEEIPLSVSGMRLQNLKIGDANASKVKFNATSLAVSSPSLTSIDAQNTTTIKNAVDLSNCPRLRSVKFAGSNASGLMLPVGAKITEASFPSAAKIVFMHSLPFLDNGNLVMPDLEGITTLYINNCPNLHPLEIVDDILSGPTNNLQYATLIWKDTVVATPSMIDSLIALADKQGYVYYEDGSMVIVNGKPHVEGSLSASVDISVSDYREIEDTFPLIQKDFDKTKVYFDFEDPEVEAIVLANWDRDSSGVFTLYESDFVTDLGNKFYNKTNIQTFDELRFFGNVTAIGISTGTGGFGGCTSLRSISLPRNIETFEPYAFYYCTSLSNIDIPESITTIKGHAFRNCPSITNKLYLPNLEILENSAFYGTGITEVQSLGNIQEIVGGNNLGAFQQCLSLTRVVLPDTLNTIGECSFMGDTALESVYLPESIIAIGRNTFNGCVSLTDIELPESIVSIGYGAFSSCPITGILNLPNLTTLGPSAFFSTPITRIDSLGKITELTGANNERGVFENCAALTKAVLPDTLTLIGSNVFRNCSSLEEVNIPATVTEIGYHAFSSAAGLPANLDSGAVRKIGNYAFHSAKGLTGYVNLPNLDEIGLGVFASTDITEIRSFGNVVSFQDAQYYNYGLAANCANLTKVRLNEATVRIGRFMFYNCPALTDINLPSTLTYVAESSFYGCPLSGELNLPRLQYIYNGAFCRTRFTRIVNLGRITTFNSTVASTGTFGSNTVLESVIVPESLTVFSNAPFQRCTNLQSITFTSQVPPAFTHEPLLETPTRNLFVPAASVRAYMLTTGLNAFSNVIPVGEDINSVVDNVWMQQVSNVFSFTEQSDYCVTMRIPLNEPTNLLRICVGFTLGSAGYGRITCHGADKTGLTSRDVAATETFTWTPAMTNVNTRFIRLTCKLSSLADCYVYDEDTGEYLWRGSDVTTHYTD